MQSRGRQRPWGAASWVPLSRISTVFVVGDGTVPALLFSLRARGPKRYFAQCKLVFCGVDDL